MNALVVIYGVIRNVLIQLAELIVTVILDTKSVETIKLVQVDNLLNILLCTILSHWTGLSSNTALFGEYILTLFKIVCKTKQPGIKSNGSNC